MQISESPAKRLRSSSPEGLAAHAQLVTLKSWDEKCFRILRNIAERSGFVRGALDGSMHYEQGAAEPVLVSLLHPSCKAAILGKVLEYLSKHENGETQAEKDKFDVEYVKVQGSILFGLALASDFLDIPELLQLTSNVIAANINSSKTAEEMRQKFESTLAEEDGGSPQEDIAVQRSGVFHLVAVELGLVQKLKTLMMCCEAFQEWKVDSMFRVDASLIGRLESAEFDFLSMMTSLQALNMSNNYLSSEMMTSLRRLTGLLSLDLSHRNVNKTDSRRLSSKLYEQREQNSNWFRAEGATELAESLSVLTGLQTLDLGGNNLGAEAREMVASLSVLRGLQTLNLEMLNLGNSTFGAEGARVLAASLSVLTALQTLNLGGNNLGAEEAREIVPSLRVLTGLQTLNLEMLYNRTNKVGAEEARMLAASLNEMKRLHNLNLEFSYVGPEVIRVLAASSLTVMMGLQTLNLGDNCLGDEGVKVLTSTLSVMTRLQSLRLHSCDFGPEGATALAASLSVLTGLRTLDLACNEFKDAGAIAIAPSLRVMTGLQSLHLAYTRFVSEGATAMAASLSVLTGLLILDLGNNGIDDVDELASSLSMLTGLQDLNFEFNHSCPTGATALAASLSVMTGLQNFNLDCNYIDNEGAIAIAGSLSVLTGLQTLHLSSNELGTRGVTALVASLSKLTGLQTLDFTDNRIEGKRIKALAVSLSVLKGLKIIY